MHLLLAVLLYLAVAVAGIGGAAGFALYAFRPPVVAAQPEAPQVPPRIQAWQDRKAEELLHAGKQKAAALAEKEQTEKLRLRIMTPAADDAMAGVIQDGTESERAAATPRGHPGDADNGRAARPRGRAHRETRRVTDGARWSARRVTDGYAAEARWSPPTVRMHGPE